MAASCSVAASKSRIKHATLSTHGELSGPWPHARCTIPNTSLFPSSTVALADANGHLMSASKKFTLQFLPPRSNSTLRLLPRGWHFRSRPPVSPASSISTSRRLSFAEIAGSRAWFNFNWIWQLALRSRSPPISQHLSACLASVILARSSLSLSCLNLSSHFAHYGTHKLRMQCSRLSAFLGRHSFRAPPKLAKSRLLRLLPLGRLLPLPRRRRPAPCEQVYSPAISNTFPDSLIGLCL